MLNDKLIKDTVQKRPDPPHLNAKWATSHRDGRPLTKLLSKKSESRRRREDEWRTRPRTKGCLSDCREGPGATFLRGLSVINFPSILDSVTLSATWTITEVTAE